MALNNYRFRLLAQTPLPKPKPADDLRNLGFAFFSTLGNVNSINFQATAVPLSDAKEDAKSLFVAFGEKNDFPRYENIAFVLLVKRVEGVPGKFLTFALRKGKCVAELTFTKETTPTHPYLVGKVTLMSDEQGWGFWKKGLSV